MVAEKDPEVDLNANLGTAAYKPKKNLFAVSLPNETLNGTLNCTTVECRYSGSEQQRWTINARKGLKDLLAGLRIWLIFDAVAILLKSNALVCCIQNSRADRFAKEAGGEVTAKKRSPAMCEIL